MSDLLDEIKDDLHEERYNKIIKIVSIIFAFIAFFVVLGTAIYVWQDRSTEKLQKDLSVVFNQALLAADNNQIDQAINHYNLIIEQKHQQYVALAYLNKAALLFKQDKHLEGQKALIEMAENKFIDGSLKGLAFINYFADRVNHSTEINLKDSDKILDSLSMDNKPWSALALEIKAINNINNNKFDQARDNLNKIMTSKNISRATHDVATSIMASIENNSR